MLTTKTMVNKKILITAFLFFFSCSMTVLMTSKKSFAGAINLTANKLAICSHNQSPKDCQEKIEIQFAQRTIFVITPTIKHE